MKKRMLSLILALSPAAAWASTGVEYVEGLDNRREGDLPTKVEEYFAANVPNTDCGVNELPKVQAHKIMSGSAHETKQPGTLTNFEGYYIVTKICFFGTTFAGAYRQLKESTLIRATRKGAENEAGAVVPTEADEFEVIKGLNLTTLTQN